MNFRKSWIALSRFENSERAFWKKVIYKRLFYACVHYSQLLCNIFQPVKLLKQEADSSININIQPVRASCISSLNSCIFIPFTTNTSPSPPPPPPIITIYNRINLYYLFLFHSLVLCSSLALALKSFLQLFKIHVKNHFLCFIFMFFFFSPISSDSPLRFNKTKKEVKNHKNKPKRYYYTT